MIRKLAHLLIFSSVYMGIGAVAMALLSFKLVLNDDFSQTYIWFVFFSAMFLYCLHRVIGIEKVKAYEDEGRFSIIKKYQKHIWICGFIGAIGSLITFIWLPVDVKLLLIFPVIISLAYVLPILPHRKRLRDFPFVKLFLVGFIWAWVTLAIPLSMSGQAYDMHYLIAVLERVFFFLSAALPFDIRDRKVDIISQIKTLPIAIGVRNSQWFAWCCLLVHFILVIFLNRIGYYPTGIVLPYFIYFLMCSLFIYNATEKQEHLYFTVFLDGTLIILPVLVWVFGA